MKSWAKLRTVKTSKFEVTNVDILTCTRPQTTVIDVYSDPVRRSVGYTLQFAVNCGHDQKYLGVTRKENTFFFISFMNFQFIVKMSSIIISILDANNFAPNRP